LIRKRTADVGVAFVVLCHAACAQSGPPPGLTEEFRIDGAQQKWARVLAIHVLPMGNIIVRHDGDYALTAFSPSGAVIRQFGKKGVEAGELDRPFNSGTIGDSIWVTDFTGNRMNLYGADGSFVRTVVRQPAGDLLAKRKDAAYLGNAVYPWRLLPGNAAIGAPPFSVQAIAAGLLATVPHFRLTWDGVVEGLITETSARGGSMIVGSSTVMQQPFTGNPELLVSPDGSRLAVVDTMDGGKPELRLTYLSINGDTLGTAAVPIVSQPVTPHMVDSVVSRISAGANGSLTEYQVRSAVTVPKTMWPAKHSFIENDDTVWLQLNSVGSDNRWVIVSPAGRIIDTLSVPPSTEIRFVDHGIWATVRDAHDVPSVVRFRRR
jgi:hypothetical protein